MKERVKELLARMAELSKGFNDEHMNAEALAEMSRSKDLIGGLDEVEKMLAKGDVEGAMKALDQMASTMDQMLAGLERTARHARREGAGAHEGDARLQGAAREGPGRAGARPPAETEKIRAEYRKKHRRAAEGRRRRR